MRLAYARGSDLDELRPGADRFDAVAPEIAHARAQAAHELLDDGDHRAFVGHPALHAFGDELVGVHRGVLEIAVRRALLHGAQRPHATIGFVRAALEQLDLAR